MVTWATETCCWPLCNKIISIEPKCIHFSFNTFYASWWNIYTKNSSYRFEKFRFILKGKYTPCIPFFIKPFPYCCRFLSTSAHSLPLFRWLPNNSKTNIGCCSLKSVMERREYRAVCGARGGWAGWYSSGPGQGARSSDRRVKTTKKIFYRNVSLCACVKLSVFKSLM